MCCFDHRSLDVHNIFFKLSLRSGAPFRVWFLFRLYRTTVLSCPRYAVRSFFKVISSGAAVFFFSFFFFFSDADNSRLEKAPASRSRRWLHTCHPPLPWKSRGSARRAGRGTRVHVCENVTSFIFKRAMRDCLFFQDTSRLFVLQILLTLLHCSSSLHTLIYSYANRQLCLQ